MRRRNLITTLMAFVLAGAGGLGACSNDPVGIDEELDHGVERIRLMLNNQIVAEYDGSSWSGELDVTQNTSSGDIQVRLIDHEGKVVTPASNISLQVDITNEAIARWEQNSPSVFVGRLRGVAAGETTAVFKLMRGGQAAYLTSPVAVRVNTP